MNNMASFTLPNGVRIYAELNGSAGGNDECDWSSIDICAEFPDKHIEVLCCADFEIKSEENPRERLRVMAFTPEKEHPAYVQEYPFRSYSVWIQHESEDGTYDINVWDEDHDERDQCMEISRIPSVREAEEKIQAIIAAHPDIRWERRDMTEGRG